jgi:6-pyruvoyltetrahydropterin/6-carboxytetrahydropterin synthase
MLQYYPDACFICGSDKFNQYPNTIRICDACEAMINKNQITVYKKVQLHVAHMLPGHETCGEMHGHSLDVVVGVRERLDFTNGMVIDFKVLKKILKEEVVDKFDHGCLNNTLPCPTAEYLAAYIYFKLNQKRMNVVMVRVHETEDNYVEFTGDGDV